MIEKSRWQDHYDPENFRKASALVIKVPMKQGDCVTRLLWWLGDQKDQPTKVSKWWSAQISW